MEKEGVVSLFFLCFLFVHVCTCRSLLSRFFKQPVPFDNTNIEIFFDTTKFILYFFFNVDNCPLWELNYVLIFVV